MFMIYTHTALHFHSAHEWFISYFQPTESQRKCWRDNYAVILYFTVLL